MSLGIPLETPNDLCLYHVFHSDYQFLPQWVIPQTRREVGHTGIKEKHPKHSVF